MAVSIFGDDCGGSEVAILIFCCGSGWPEAAKFNSGGDYVGSELAVSTFGGDYMVTTVGSS